MDQQNIVKDVRKFVKPMSAKDWRKLHKNDEQYGYHFDDIVTSYIDKYILNKPKQYVYESEEELTDSQLSKLFFDESSPIASSQLYVMEALETSLAPLKTNLNPEKVVKNPIRFRKPLNLSQLRKILRNSKYFE